MEIRERPGGVTVMGVIALIIGLLGIWPAMLAVLGAGFFTAVGGPPGATLGLVIIVASLFLVISPLLYIAFGIGALQLKPWAWLMGVLGSAFGILGALGHNVGQHGGGQTGIHWFGLLVSAGILIYLLQPNIKAAFRG